jgi:hypothetical protein
MTAIMTSSITGAGLVIAYYALIANMSEKVFANRFERINRYRQEIKRISSDPESFNDENLKETTERLGRLRKKTDSMKTFPKYLGLGILINFTLFLLTAYFSFNWLGFSADIQSRMELNQVVIIVLFTLSIFLFLFVGIYGISDILSTLWSNFDKLKKEKEEIKKEIEHAPKAAKIFEKIISILTKKNVDFEINAKIKVDGRVLVPDIIIRFKKKIVYFVEILSKPTADKIYHLFIKYEKFKEHSEAKFILVADFESRQSLLNIAKSYWDIAIDVEELDKLGEIIAN